MVNEIDLIGNAIHNIKNAKRLNDNSFLDMAVEQLEKAEKKILED